MMFRHGVLGEKEEGRELTALQVIGAAWRLREPALTPIHVSITGAAAHACLSRGALMGTRD